MREYQLLFALAWSDDSERALVGIATCDGEGERTRRKIHGVGIAKLIPRRWLSRSCKFDSTASRARVPLQQYPATSAGVADAAQTPLEITAIFQPDLPPYVSPTSIYAKRERERERET